MSLLTSGRVHAFESYSIYLAAVGRFREALIQVMQAQQLDPLSAHVNTYVGRVLYFARQYDAAIQQLRETLEWNSRYILAYRFIGDAYTQKGMYQEGLAEYRKGSDLLGLNAKTLFNKNYKTLALSGDAIALLCSIGYLYGASRNTEGAQQILAFLKKVSKAMFVSPLRIAELYVGLGEYDKALASLEQACELHVHGFYMISVSPKYECLRANRRFQQLVSRICPAQDPAARVRSRRLRGLNVHRF